MTADCDKTIEAPTLITEEVDVDLVSLAMPAGPAVGKRYRITAKLADGGMGGPNRPLLDLASRGARDPRRASHRPRRALVVRGVGAERGDRRRPRDRGRLSALVLAGC